MQLGQQFLIAGPQLHGLIVSIMRLSQGETAFDKRGVL